MPDDPGLEPLWKSKYLDACRENARLREALKSVCLDALECSGSEPKQFTVTEWAMRKVWAEVGRKDEAIKLK